MISHHFSVEAPRLRIRTSDAGCHRSGAEAYRFDALLYIVNVSAHDEAAKSMAEKIVGNKNPPWR